ncbi:FAD-dependent urate hydroxylase [Marinomonas spartinae]|uniref:FAD-dependent oxidoreductase n=1 Tax=Marinomonas spartinae TaxID=1792290 RepID=UPI0008090B07|nr:FAD-dependent oxidoreductase [Marinomonas spartinae]SBS29487.1 FAD-dependent urate hydroxylase [Marinomonas spartinae]
MSAVNKVLIVGGGFSGMATAIELRKHDIEADLVELDTSWRPEGAGISLGAATLRALEKLGVYEEFEKEGHHSTGADLLAPHGALIAHISGGGVEGSEVTGEGAILRPKLGKILSNKVLELGTNVFLGNSFETIEQDEHQVHVTFLDGTKKDYDLVIGAEGLHSKLRGQFFPNAPTPEYVGQGVWRAVIPRPSEINSTRIWLSDDVKIGVNPCSDANMYMFITESRPTKDHIDPILWTNIMADLIKPFPDPALQALIPHLFEEGANIDYRPLFNLLMPAPWNKGRVVLIGDSVAATTPHLASGACIGIESGIVLADELHRQSTLQAALDAFHERRFKRCELVVKNSARLSEIEIQHGDKQEHGQLMKTSFQAMAQAI